jgi:hypothetical protein
VKVELIWAQHHHVDVTVVADAMADGEFEKSCTTCRARPNSSMTSHLTRPRLRLQALDRRPDLPGFDMAMGIEEAGGQLDAGTCPGASVVDTVRREHTVIDQLLGVHIPEWGIFPPWPFSQIGILVELDKRRGLIDRERNRGRLPGRRKAVHEPELTRA